MPLQLKSQNSKLKTISKISKILILFVFITFTFYLLPFTSVHAQTTGHPPDQYGCTWNYNMCGTSWKGSDCETLGGYDYHSCRSFTGSGPNAEQACNGAVFKCGSFTQVSGVSPGSTGGTTGTTGPGSSGTTANLGPVPTPYPQPTPVSCNVYKKGEEFHSLRPYQASPCKMSIDEPSQLCGNTMLINDAITVGRGDANGGCDDISANTIRCHYIIPRSFNIWVDPSRAELPIAGNTEEVQNRYSANATIDNATQVNDYLSWYLNGTIFRAEEINRFKKDPTTGVYDYSPMLDYAGPIRKLLPQLAQNQARAAQVTNAINSIDNNAQIRHNQTVACIYDIQLFNFDVTILGFNIKTDGVNIGGIPAPCPVNGTNENWLQKLWSAFKGSFTRELSLTDWKGHLPPEQKPNESLQDYYKRYETWRGKSCLSIKIPGTLPFIGNVPLVGGMEVTYCFDDPTKPNFWANEFPWIPFTSTEDKLGDLTFAVPQSTGGDVIVMASPAPVFKNLTTGAINTPISTNLYFPHMEENKQLSEILSTSYLPKDLQGDSSLGTTVPVEQQANCKILDIRTNPGDKLFGNISAFGSYSYTAQFDCDFTWHYEVVTDPITGQPITTSTKVWEPSECKKNATFASNVNVDTPMINSTWAILVAGNTSDFRRIFPKLGSASLGDIKDIPAVSSNVYYNAQNTGSYGNTSAGPVPAEIYFPHLGGISEYFLKAIQTILRPKGFGEPVEFANQPKTASCGSGTMPTLPSASGACKLCGASIPTTLQQIFEAAGQAYGVPASVIYGTFLHEGGDRLSLTESNVKQWSVCGGEVPGCDKNSSAAQIPFGWFPPYFYSGYWDAVTQVDPSRTKDNTSPCNLLDAAFATAKSLSQWSGGLPTSVKYPASMDPTQSYSRFPDMCYSYNLKNGEATAGSCAAWDTNYVATSQVGYGGYCPEPGKHPIGSAFPDNNGFIQTTVDAFNKYTCH